MLLPPSDGSKVKETLEAVHTFPGPYEFILMGDNTEAFKQGLVDAVRAVIPDADPKITTRHESKQARYQSLALVVQVENSQAVIDIHARLREVPGIKSML